MITIKIPIPPTLGAYGEAISAMLPQLAEAIRGDLVSMAKRDLNSSEEEYVKGLVVQQTPVSAKMLKKGVHTFARIVQAGGFLAQAVELGWAPLGSSGEYDMKPAQLKGRSGEKRGGQSAVIRFRHQTPGTKGRMAPVMGGPERRSGMSLMQSELLGKALGRAAQKITATTTNPGQKTTWGDRLAAGVGGAKKLKSHHKSDIYAGMMRHQKTYSKKSDSQYSTYRTVSSKVKGKWIHPGIEAHGFFRKATKRIEGHTKLLLTHIAKGMSRA